MYPCGSAGDAMKLSPRMRAEKEFVEEYFGPAKICGRCDATLKTYSYCPADLDDACPGFLAIERAKKQFSKDNPTTTRNGSGDTQVATGGTDGHSAESRNDVKSPSTPPLADQGPWCPKFKAFSMLDKFISEFLSAEEKARIFPPYPHSPEQYSYLEHHAFALHKHARLIGDELSKPMYRSEE